METLVSNVQDLQSKSQEEIFDLIRQRLSFDESIGQQIRHVDKEEFKKEHRRFEMSGYESESETGSVTLFNTAILNEFADLGIYDYTHYLFLDFFKGTPTIYLRYFGDDENQEFNLDGYGTIEIIFKVFELTIFSGKRKRRRL